MTPHATDHSFERRRSSQSRSTPTRFKFPDLSQEQLQAVSDDHGGFEDISRGPSPLPLPKGLPTGMHSNERWPARRDSRAKNNWGPSSLWTNGSASGSRHGRQKSLSEAIRTVRTRKMSMSENAQEIADSLRAPVSMRLVLLCGVWYATSILTNTSSKAILTALPRPVTLTVVQFLLVSFWCVFLSALAKRNAAVRSALPFLKNGLRKPSKEIIMATLPLTAFQIGGHILNSDAMSRIPVSLVHTIKGLSPLMTVFAYRIFFNTRYSVPTYLSLIPLTLGVILACSASFKGNLVGLTYAFGSAILFVTQNIVSKQIFNEAAKAEADGTPVGRRKPDKLNLLCYSSATAFLLTCPIWLWSEGLPMMADLYQDGAIDLSQRPGSLDHGRLTVEFVFNGTFHFGQSLVAFVLLGMVSPVTYSVASLIKRVVVIMFAIVWFGSAMTHVQGFGFALTFLGLYLYDRTSDTARADARTREKGEGREPLLPLNVGDAKRNDGLSSGGAGNGGMSLSPMDMGANGYMLGGGDPRGSSPSTNGAGTSLPPGTKAEQTWNPGDMARHQYSQPVR